MKKIILLSAISLLMISCTNTSNKEVTEVPKEIGFDMTQGFKTPLFWRRYGNSCGLGKIHQSAQ